MKTRWIVRELGGAGRVWKCRTKREARARWRKLHREDPADFFLEVGSNFVIEPADLLELRIGRCMFLVVSIADAQRMYVRERTAAERRGPGGGGGSREFPVGRLSNGMTISYNGSVWRGNVKVAA